MGCGGSTNGTFCFVPKKETPCTGSVEGLLSCEQRLIFLCLLGERENKALQYLESVSSKILSKVNQFNPAKPVFHACDYYLTVNH